MVNSEISNQLTTNNRPSRLAILDLGTNTFHLLIADIEEGSKPLIIYHETIAVRLGEGGISEGTIYPEAFERGIKAIATFKQRIDQYQVGEVKSAATSAIRSASNGTDFIERVKAVTALDLEIIDGEREAELIYHGVRAAVNLEHISLIVDIGGGSVEFIICDKHQIFWKKSYPIGAARMMARYHHTDPILETEVAQFKNHLENTLGDLINRLERYQPGLMIGSAGAFETFAALQDPEYRASFEKPETTIDLDKFNNTSKMIIESTHAEREGMPGIPLVRVDMIVVSAILTDYILSRSGINRLKLSSYSLKEGLLFEMLK